VIPDAVHVAPEILRLIYMARGARRMILTTDKVSLASTTAEASVNVGRERARIADGAARLPDGTLAGAVISMLAGARLMTENAGAGIGEVVMMAASNPATVASHSELGRLQHGAVSDIIVLNEALELKAVFLAGRELK
jgi:N-acetylglucosamine-6-phosphate deacetylase